MEEDASAPVQFVGADGKLHDIDPVLSSDPEAFEQFLQSYIAMQQISAAQQQQIMELQAKLNELVSEDEPFSGILTDEQRKELEGVYRRKEIQVSAGKFSSYFYSEKGKTNFDKDREMFLKANRILPTKQTAAMKRGKRKHELLELIVNSNIRREERNSNVVYGKTFEKLIEGFAPTWLVEVELPKVYVDQISTRLPDRWRGHSGRGGQYRDIVMTDFWMAGIADTLEVLGPESNGLRALKDDFNMTLDKSANTWVVGDYKGHRDVYDEGKPFWPDINQVFFLCEMLTQLTDKKYHLMLAETGTHDKIPSVYKGRGKHKRFDTDVQRTNAMIGLERPNIVAEIVDRDTTDTMYAQVYDAQTRQDFLSCLANSTYRVLVEGSRHRAYTDPEVVKEPTIEPLFDF